jgi:ADP-dependent NAD(P)H-hydrate dehydratase / NAD(P)H-hydrate epimerase
MQMYVYLSKQIREWDYFTLLHNNIESIDLMETAGRKLFQTLKSLYPSTESKFHIYCGTGNNGGDGLVVARLLYQEGYKVCIVENSHSGVYSEEYLTNINRIIKSDNINIYSFLNIQEFNISPEIIAIDAIIGVGLDRPLNPELSSLVRFINESYNQIVAIDVPTGMSADHVEFSDAIQATHTLTIQSPKYSFLFPEAEKFIGKLSVINIGLDAQFADKNPPLARILSREMISAIRKCRSKNSYKNNFGHAALACGSVTMSGAALLASKACIRAGVGLLTSYLPGSLTDTLRLYVPEAMIQADQNALKFEHVEINSRHEVLGIGCGIGQSDETSKWLFDVLIRFNGKMVLDADALNLISIHKRLDLLSRVSIITPHIGEFDRLFGPHRNGIERVKTQLKMSEKYKLVIILKGAYTSITTPDTKLYFNMTGNPGMATAGSGDVLTGITTAMLSQGYDSFESAALAVFIHGLAGDIATDFQSEESLIASDIINFLGLAFKSLDNNSL